MPEFNRVALTRELPGDLSTPVGTYLALGNRPYSYLLESMHGGERWGRYSFIGLPAREVLRIRGNQVSVEVDGKVVLNVESTDPIANLRAGIQSGRYRITSEQLPAVIATISGATLAAMLPVLEGHGTWRDVGSDTAELVLVALGVAREEARALARSELAPLPSAD